MEPLLVTSQASSSVTTHKMYLILLKRSKTFHWRQNRFEILQLIKNSAGGGVLHPPPTTILAKWGYEFACTSEVKPPRGLIYFKPICGGSLFATEGLIYLEKTMVSVLMYKKVEGRIRIKSELPDGK